jgi:hypothetical protein
VNGPLLFSFICKQQDEYREVTVCQYMHQLISALGYLHCQGVAHLDVKVTDGVQWSTGPVFFLFEVQIVHMFKKIFVYIRLIHSLQLCQASRTDVLDW